MKYILGIDIGTGSTKAVALDLYGATLETSQQHYPSFSTRPGYLEQDPEQIWKALYQCLEEMVLKMNGAPVAIGFSSAMHSVIPVNQEGGALAPMMTWADSRSAAVASRIIASEDWGTLYRATGTPIHAMSPLCKLIWLKENEPVLFGEAYKFISIKEYLWYKLFGVFEIDHSIASCTGLFDITQLCWHQAALELAGITPDHLSAPVSTGYGRSGAAIAIDGLKDTLFVTGASDGCLANLGTYANAPGIAALTIGTSGAVRIMSDQPIYNNEAMTFNYLLDEQIYVCGGPVNNGGIALQWLLKNVWGRENLSQDDYTELFKQVETVPAGSEGLIFLPYLTGERAPIWDTASCGTFFGLRLHHQQAHLARATLEGICYALNDVLNAVAKHAPEITHIHVSGGFIHSKIWMQILADITGRKVVLVQEADASAVGAAYLAARTLGLSGVERFTPDTEQVIVPDPANHELYLQVFQLFSDLYGNLKTGMHRLQQLYQVPQTK